MDFDFSDDQVSLRDAVRRWVDKGFGFERRHALAQAGGASRAVYSELCELGLAGLVVPEALGGLGQGARAADVTMAAAKATLITLDGHAAIETAVDVGLAAHCAEAVGLMDKLVDITVDYMNTRKQFGSTLASFQALRHRMADVKMQLELGRSMSYFASLKLGEAPAQRRRAVAQARVQLGHSMRLVGQQCIQLHGGIACTDDYIASHYFKRLTMLELTLGDTLHHLGEVSARMQDTAGVFA
jgi:alkylation response protein AidB-like acyl-CoA dehydrogenase